MFSSGCTLTYSFQKRKSNFDRGILTQVVRYNDAPIFTSLGFPVRAVLVLVRDREKLNNRPVN